MQSEQAFADRRTAPRTDWMAVAVAFDQGAVATPARSSTGDLAALAQRLKTVMADGAPILCCHKAATARRLDISLDGAFDVLELFAFVRPAVTVLPTPRGLAAALDLPLPTDLQSAAEALLRIADALLAEIVETADVDAAGIAMMMGRGGWPWAPYIVQALGGPVRPERAQSSMAVWRRLPQWDGEAPDTPPRDLPVDPDEARTRLADMLGSTAEARPQQASYASAVAGAFQTRHDPEATALVVAEAGTGTGKTLGYIAPASLWAERNGAPVWISTFTRNLQRQIDQELVRLYPDPVERSVHVVTRKGRENYLCLLNLEDASNSIAMNPGVAPALGLMARWTAATRDGDMVGGDLPGWLPGLVGRGRTLGLSDRRGECIYSACPHYGRCFIERSVRRARRADLVIANHALVMTQAALGGMDDTRLPTRLVFDEGHHLFDAADNVFCAHLSGQEGADLRRWIRGSEARQSRSRMRGLRNRYGELTLDDPTAEKHLNAAIAAAVVLPGEGWHQRLADGRPDGPAEYLLHLVRRQVYARVDPRSPYSLECDVRPVEEALLEAATGLATALKDLVKPLRALAARFAARLDEEADALDTTTRTRLEAAVRALGRRADTMLPAWIDMLAALSSEPDPRFIDWLTIERIGGSDADVGYYRHWLDPTAPLADAVLREAHGVVVTSATLTDGSGAPELDWHEAEARVGAVHLPDPAQRAKVVSPFDYPAQTKVFIVTDVRKDDLDQVAAAYRELFVASGGGGLGLFTAISRLRAVHQKIAGPLAQHRIDLLAQHVDAMDAATLIDIFRAEETTCLLGTDAVRDGVDVPGRALRLLVFDRVPWPRPSIAHRARREAFVEGGGERRAYDDMLTRLRLKQAFGRLVRRADDHGVFVLLDPMTPTRLLGAFPEGVAVERVGLADAVAATKDFLAR